MIVVVDAQDFQCWPDVSEGPTGLVYVRHLAPTESPVGATDVYAWTAEDDPRDFFAPDIGAVFGFVSRGLAVVDGMRVSEGQWFCTRSGAALTLRALSRAFGAQTIGFLGMPCVGGPIERRGRLRYIDSCSDSLLVAPPLRGDPCLNHLHFPAGIDQTEHTHPSVRVGIVARGAGECVTPSGRHPLLPGTVFLIPTGGRHSFNTLGGLSMDVIAYHPDSDFGPQHEDHPMVNRTLVDGAKIDNTAGRHMDADVVSGWFVPKDIPPR